MIAQAQLIDVVAPVAAAMRHAAEVAIMPRYRLPTHILQKSKGEIVTLADQQAEAILTPILLKLVEGTRVVGEEAAEADPRLLHELDRGLVWLVDPLDGTSNFVSGSGAFAVMVALMSEGVTIASWIYDPIARSECIAVKGMGARIDGRAISSQSTVARAADLSGAILTRFFGARSLGITRLAPCS